MFPASEIRAYLLSGVASSDRGAGRLWRAKVLQVAGMSHGRQRERLSLNRMQSLRRECGYSSHSRGTNYHQLDPMYKKLKVQILQQLRREAQSTE